MYKYVMSGRYIKNGARFGFDDLLANDLADFCEANLGSPGQEIIRRAVRKYIDDFLEDDPKMAERFNDARKKRISEGRDSLRVVSLKDDC